jgi:hypothetical protein
MVLALGCGVWMVSGESETIRRARLIRLGMTEDEVKAIMGEPAVTYVSMYSEIAGSDFQPHPYSNHYGTAVEQLRNEWSWKLSKFAGRIGAAWQPKSLSVEIDFDGRSRVTSFRRGSEVVGR